MKIIFLKILLISSVSEAFIGEIIDKADDKVQGALAASILMDDLLETVNNGVDIGTLEKLAIEHSVSLAELKGESVEAAIRYENLKNVDKNYRKSSEITNSLRKAERLIGVLCAFGLEGCQLAMQQRSLTTAKDSNKVLMDIRNTLLENQKKEEIEKVKKTKRRIDLMKSIENTPNRILNLLGGNK